MDVIARYIYAVTSRLPSGQREEVEKELKGLIEDLLSEGSSERASEPSQKKDIEAVLLELGDPSLLADKYRDTRRFLIGPGHFDMYLSILKIVTFCVALGLTVALTIGYIVNPPENILVALVTYIASILAAAAQAFAGITIVFALFEYYDVNVFEPSRRKNWNPADLPRVPDKAARIKPSEPIFGIIFTVLFIILLNAAHQLLGLYIFDEGSLVTVIPLFNQEVLATFLPYFTGLLILAISRECLKLVIGKWTLALATINIVLNAASLIVFIMAFSRFDIWNNDFLSYITQTGILPAGTNIETLWRMFTKGLMAVVALGFTIDSIVSMAKALKHKVALFL